MGSLLNDVSTIDPNDVIVMVLGGGQGSRLYPLTKNRAKPAVSFGGKYRLIDIPITNCLSSQLNKIFILTQFNSFSLNRHIWQAYSGEVGRDGFIDVIAAEQTTMSREWFQGTADAVRQSLQYVLYHKPKYILILSGDQVYSMDYRFLFSFHASHNADVTIASHYTAEDEIKGLGIIKVNENYKVISFFEKPNSPQQVADYKLKTGSESDKPFLASMGIYLFSTDVLVEALDNNKTDFGKEIIPAMADKVNMYTFPFSGYWEDVGTIKAFYDANMEWLQGRGIAELYKDGNSIITHSRQLPPARIFNTNVSNSIIAEGSTIRAKEVKNSIIGVRSRIGENTIIEDSIIMGNNKMGFFGSDDIANTDDEESKILKDNNYFEIGKDCVIKKAILDKDVIIGNGCKLINKDNLTDYECDEYVIKDGIIVIAQKTVIPEGTII